MSIKGRFHPSLGPFRDVRAAARTGEASSSLTSRCWIIYCFDFKMRFDVWSFFLRGAGRGKKDSGLFKASQTAVAREGPRPPRIKRCGCESALKRAKSSLIQLYLFASRADLHSEGLKRFSVPFVSSCPNKGQPVQSAPTKALKSSCRHAIKRCGALKESILLITCKRASDDKQNSCSRPLRLFDELLSCLPGPDLSEPEAAKPRQNLLPRVCLP